MRDSIFISYSRRDEHWAERFHNMLKARPDDIKVFRDSNIREGEDWETRLQVELARAKIALLLVSPSFVNSDFITKHELPWMLRSRQDGLVVKWVEVEPAIPPDELERLQAFKVQSSSRCLSQLHGGDQDAEIKKICERLIEAMAQHSRVPRGEFFNRVSDVVQKRFGYTVRHELAIGDHSVVYTAEGPGKHLIVKAQVVGLFEEDGHDDLQSIANELEIAKNLRHPVFIPLRDWSLDTEPRILVTDFVETEPLHRIMGTSAKDGFPVGMVRFIVQQIAAALAEYHDAGLAYDNIRPSDVLLPASRHGDWCPRISAYRATQISLKWEQRNRRFQINPERLTYVAPEQYEEEAVTPETDQYSLGLLAIEMLQGAPPIRVERLADLEKKKAFFDDPEGFGGNWLQRSPELASIILRMLERNPRKRWPSMARVSEALGGGATVADNNRKLAKESYFRLMKQREQFFEAFYENLFRRRKNLRDKFPANHDWKRQHAMLEAAVRSLLNFSQRHVVEPTILTETAARHRGLKLTKKNYEAFEEAFIKTLAKFGEGCEEIEFAWRASFAAGMDYMKRHGSGP